ncbi:hypothetical protein J14TS5_21430 [Paenibacillus lautus]|nr:hypothetical protein J14TS5_21430 [Paenibacillus lautus]
MAPKGYLPPNPLADRVGPSYIECTKETVPFGNGLGSTSILPKNGFFASKSKQSARRSGEDESIPDKQQRW